MGACPGSLPVFAFASTVRKVWPNSAKKANGFCKKAKYFTKKIKPSKRIKMATGAIQAKVEASLWTIIRSPNCVVACFNTYPGLLSHFSATKVRGTCDHDFWPKNPQSVMSVRIDFADFDDLWSVCFCPCLVLKWPFAGRSLRG